MPATCCEMLDVHSFIGLENPRLAVQLLFSKYDHMEASMHMSSYHTAASLPYRSANWIYN